MADWELVKATLGYIQQFDVEQPKDTAKNLTGYTNYLVVWKKGASTYIFKTELTAVDLSLGQVKYTTNSTDDALLGIGAFYLWTILCDAGAIELPTKPQTLEVLEGPPSS